MFSSTLETAIRSRFIAYLSGGDEAKANKILKGLHVVGGLDGLDFSGSCVKSGKLYIKLKYELNYEFNAFNLGKVKLGQSVCSKIWK